MQQATTTSIHAAQKACTSCFRVLGVESKYKLYALVKNKGSQKVSDFVDCVNLTQPTVTSHLQDLEDAGLLKKTKIGRNVYYSLNEKCPTYNCSCVLKNIEFTEE